ncbi:AsmA-like C-terminal region-containing protein [Pedobacter sp. SYP-B3415]|uniref:AsmA-like C-terminal region-containing protein n=1 Tax=Pedobacter sp. SYP-B3415 TaxID=2496641 RepID=UPI00101D4413|nr:AsmA-like C-terminal region-containing protein [Pedobacter sp. SYP-B3415]
MARWLKLSLKIIGGVLLLFILLFVAGGIYISSNREKVLKSLVEKVNGSINGKFVAGSIDPSFLKGFPNASLSVRNVLLTDSLFNRHRHELLKASDIDVSLDLLSLLVGNFKISKVSINNASIYLYTDSSGYSNTSLFKTKKEKAAESGGGKPDDIQLNRIDLNKVQFVIDNQARFKKFDFDVSSLSGRINYPSEGFKGKIKLRTLVRAFSFNTRRGSFMHNKVLDGNLSFHYDKDKEVLIADPDRLNIGGDDFKIGASVQFGQKPAPFSVNIAADKILYSNVAKLLAPNISSKLLRFKIDKPVDVRATILDDGKSSGKDPLINVGITVRNNIVTIPSGKLEECSFDGAFTNRDTANRPIGDANSSIKFRKLKANYYQAPITVDTLLINNLERPVAIGRVLSKFDLEKLNGSFGDNMFRFKSGHADLELFGRADIENFRFTKPTVSGRVLIRDADITYLPKNIHLVKSALALQFTENDLSINEGRLQLGKSIVTMNLRIKNLLNFYYTAPEKTLIELSINSPQIYLNELMPFLTQRKKAVRKRSTANSLNELSDQLGTVLESAQMKMQLHVDKAIYNRFVARNLDANIDLLRDGVYLRKIHVNHAGGGLDLTGNIKPFGSVNRFTVRSTVNNVSVREFFYSFDNFGQNTITNKNLRGFLSSTVDINGAISDQGKIISRSTNGRVRFSLRKGALINFEPLKKVESFAFKNRDFSNIQLQTLNGTLNVKGDKVYISPLMINSSVLNFNIKGVYALSKGTNIAMDIPLRNPKKDEFITDPKEKKAARMKGIVLHLKATDGEDGKIKIGWNRDHD